ncbi:MAG TPA: hypothetical protein DHV62_05425 [Elusimicrobia bacterium]|jgi:ubiquinone/menaquinone biosynthesis C-methylase UbiE|nr:hypothetical protein [Elusimicrobiota bacterium]
MGNNYKIQQEKIRKLLRQRDMEIIFRKCPKQLFNRGLEIGAGDGYQSYFLKMYVKNLTVTDIDEDLIQNKIPKVDYRSMDAKEIDKYFERNSIDLIFSSNVLEHIPNIKLVLQKMKLVLSNEGIMIHTIPNPFWKVLQFLFFIPDRIRSMCVRFLNSHGNSHGKIICLKRKNMPELFPSSHGGQVSTLKEFYFFSKKYWTQLFLSSGLEILKTKKLQFHSPYRFGCPFTLREILGDLGMNTTTAYILKKVTEKTSYEQYFN